MWVRSRSSSLGYGGAPIAGSAGPSSPLPAGPAPVLTADPKLPHADRSIARRPTADATVTTCPGEHERPVASDAGGSAGTAPPATPGRRLGIARAWPGGAARRPRDEEPAVRRPWTPRGA